jgi:hypothetical protein
MRHEAARWAARRIDQRVEQRGVPLLEVVTEYRRDGRESIVGARLARHWLRHRDDRGEHVELGLELRAARERIVALEQHRLRPGLLQDALQELANRGGDGVCVGIAPHDIDARAAGDVDVGDAIERQAIECDRAMVDDVRVQVRDVEHELHARAIDELREEVGFRRVFGPRQRRGDVLECEGDRQAVGRALHVVDEHGQLPATAGHRHEVRALHAPRAHECDVLADERRAQGPGDRAQPGESRRVGLAGAAEREARAVGDDDEAALDRRGEHRRHALRIDGLGDDLGERDAALLDEPRRLRAPAEADRHEHPPQPPQPPPHPPPQLDPQLEIQLLVVPTSSER